MPKIAFWNTNGNVPVNDLRAFVDQYDLDILVLSENSVETRDLLVTLNQASEKLWFADVGNSKRLTIMTRFQISDECLVHDSPGIAIRHYSMPIGESLLLVAVHLPSKLWKTSDDQILLSTRLGRYIQQAEQNFCHTRTLLIGDLNMNPFEIGVVGSEGLHAMMDRRTALKRDRMVFGERQSFFYNPTWSWFGDCDESPSGTYFHDSGSEVNYYWNIFDQILIRPSIIPNFEKSTIVTKIGRKSLITDRGIPNDKEFSDHLPIICQMTELTEPQYAV